ncbi:hypothetical protein CBM2615_B80007 [Cupriavidus taiwanensis]|uniref:Uncharacterized protein n=1 Tax=Cupriavidus taiwanensis TaxID=164546 RepID=A0A375EAZ5_9BURK|nr:hypothetical protein CBM2614_B80007 [Cupriavidus taiwanensis]SOZ70938.1 hypothetical protein CBM2615_B80007 [Cupriavidus taiwanensis]SOZ73630.1 hypothetical protein CBM2613_B60007 [Cupriavidus taiwanensis]
MAGERLMHTMVNHDGKIGQPVHNW